MSSTAEALDNIACYKLAMEDISCVLAITSTVKENFFNLAELLTQLF